MDQAMRLNQAERDAILACARQTFGQRCVVRLRLVHSDPDDPRHEAEVLNRVYDKASDLASAFEGMVTYANEKFGIRAEGT